MNERTDKDFEALKSQIKTDLDLQIFKAIQEAKYKKEERKTFMNSPLAPIILSALFGLIGTGIGAWLQGRQNLNLEKQKLQADLILKMIETDDQQKAALNLDFLIKTGLVEDDTLKAKIADVIKNKNNVPTLGIGSIISGNLEDKNPNVNYVKQLQDQLKQLHLFNGEVDGVESQALKAAVINFQKNNGLTADGIVSFVTLSKIEEEYKKNVTK